MRYTLLQLSDNLPLTCSRSGNCCHGNKVLINPWELAVLANEMKLSAREFKEKHTEWSGIRLQFNGAVGYAAKHACSLYASDSGCSVHVARPLACRLFPLGRQIQNDRSVYIHPGKSFPCLEGCPEVQNLPYQTVSEYLQGQQTEKWELAQSSYLEVMQQLADMAFELLLDSGLSASGDRKTLQEWRRMEQETADTLANRMGQHWLDQLTVPAISSNPDEPLLFCEQHFEALQQQFQSSFGNIQTLDELSDASVLIMSMAVFLSIAIGVESKSLLAHWIDIAKQNGAKE